MSDNFNMDSLKNTGNYTNLAVNGNNTIVATLIATFGAGWAATRRDFDIIGPGLKSKDNIYNISVLGKASTNYNIEVKNFETYYNIPNNIPTIGYPLVATYTVFANQVGAAGRVQDSRNITGMYIGNSPIGSTGGRLTITNAATLPGDDQVLYITIRKF